MATKKAAPKKTTAKKKPAASKARSKKSTLQSFRLTRSPSPFLTIAITRQTLYWGIIAVAVLVLGLWIIHLQNKVNEIYDAIEITSIDNSITPVKKN